MRAKDGKGILVDKGDTKYSRKASADQKSPRVKAIQGCIREKTKGHSSGSREEWRNFFKKKSKECKEEISLE